MNYVKLLSAFRRSLRYIIGGIPRKTVIANIIQLPPNELLKDRCAIITGGTSGIGYAISIAMLKAGATIIITGRNEIRLEETLNKIIQSYPQYKNNVYFHALDNTDILSFDRNIALIKEKIDNKKISILVNNAGIIGNEFPKVSPEEVYEKVMDTNLKGTYFLSKKIAQYMIENHIEGNILNIASASSVRPAISPYQLSKWGLRGLTMGFAKMLAPYGIIVNGIAPGPTATSMLLKKGKKNLYIDNPLGRMTFPEEIANMAVILTSDFGKSTLGSIVYMTGGSGLLTFDDISYDI